MEYHVNYTGLALLFIKVVPEVPPIRLLCSLSVHFIPECLESN